MGIMSTSTFSPAIPAFRRLDKGLARSYLNKALTQAEDDRKNLLLRKTALESGDQSKAVSDELNIVYGQMAEVNIAIAELNQALFIYDSQGGF